MTKLSVKGFIAKRAPNKGERVWLIYDSQDGGFPMFYPTAYTMAKLRGIAASTQQDHQYSIKKMYEWAKFEDIDLHTRLTRKEYLDGNEYDRLVDFLSKKFNDKLTNAISNLKARARIDHVGSYLTWYATKVLTDTRQHQNDSNIKDIKINLDERKPKKKSYSRELRKRMYKKMEEPMRLALSDFLENPTMGVSKPSYIGTNYRTATILQVVSETGCRKSEALGLQLEHYTRATAGNPASLYFERTHGNAEDHRLNEPTVKTNERIYPLSDETAEMIETYLSLYRAQIPNVSFDSSSHIFVTHLAGHNQGKALEISAFDSSFARLKRRYPKLRGLHCHLLRHDWNYEFSKFADEKGYGEQKAGAERCYLAGWNIDSPMPDVYNRRHIAESAQESAMELARTKRRDKKT
jgi:integrase